MRGARQRCDRDCNRNNSNDIDFEEQLFVICWSFARWMNGQHLRQAADEEVLEMLSAEWTASGIFSQRRGPHQGADCMLCTGCRSSLSHVPHRMVLCDCDSVHSHSHRAANSAHTVTVTVTVTGLPCGRRAVTVTALDRHGMLATPWAAGCCGSSEEQH